MQMTKKHLDWIAARIEADKDHKVALFAADLFLDLFERFPGIVTADFDRKRFLVACDLYDANEEHQRSLRKAREG